VVCANGAVTIKLEEPDTAKDARPVPSSARLMSAAKIPDNCDAAMTTRRFPDDPVVLVGRKNA
jgi:hypothetical protein